MTRKVPLALLEWQPCHRLIPSRYPTVGLYDAIADPADLDVVFAIEALTNPRIRDEIGELHLVPPEERVAGQREMLLPISGCEMPCTFCRSLYPAWYVAVMTRTRTSVSAP